MQFTSHETLCLSHACLSLIWSVMRFTERFDMVLLLVNYSRMSHFRYHKLLISCWELWFIEKGSSFMASNTLESPGMVHDKRD